MSIAFRSQPVQLRDEKRQVAQRIEHKKKQNSRRNECIHAEFSLFSPFRFRQSLEDFRFFVIYSPGPKSQVRKRSPRKNPDEIRFPDRFRFEFIAMRSYITAE